ncbi:hypothetical protein [Rossellomorea aquimaris]|uniref:Uncharacterized protein n=1 Tax=Rossellomorea aquimaris TaxID=189382 RepID=A0A1J6WEP6_9BACI|nr:hypothetical protein [Rossellomorea aquimaris]OIU70360.1 hypothetical protein BHE18_11610 [Rossellomorea aquimaris]
MGDIDKKNRLEESPFQYRVTKSGVVFIDYEGRQVKILKGKDADRFLEKLKTAGSEKERQLVMAKITGNFKRGNERL